MRAKSNESHFKVYVASPLRIAGFNENDVRFLSRASFIEKRPTLINPVKRAFLTSFLNSAAGNDVLQSVERWGRGLNGTKAFASRRQCAVVNNRLIVRSLIYHYGR